MLFLLEVLAEPYDPNSETLGLFSDHDFHSSMGE